MTGEPLRHNRPTRRDAAEGMMMMPGRGGPPPDPQSRRQRGNQSHTWYDLPMEGYDGPVPTWPYASDAPPEWAEVWRTPQAAVWARQGWERTIARYIAVMLRAEEPDASAAVLGEARQLEDRLGLNPQAMLRNRWRVKADDTAERRKSTPTKASSSKRMRIVDDDAVESA